jgi:hypothetical protein
LDLVIQQLTALFFLLSITVEHSALLLLVAPADDHRPAAGSRV